MDYNTCKLELSKYDKYLKNTYPAKNRTHSILVLGIECFCEDESLENYYVSISYLNKEIKIQGTMTFDDFLKLYFTY